MAKKFDDKALERAVDELFKNYKEAIRTAAQEATDKAKNDIHAHAVSCLARYYDDYEPTIYNRTYSLLNCFVPYSNTVIEKDGMFECIAGVEYDASLLVGVYSGSETYTPTDAQWVIDNYLMGIHPRTNGSYIVGGGNYEYETALGREDYKYKGNFVPADEAQIFLDSYRNTFNAYFRRSLGKQVLKIAAK